MFKNLFKKILVVTTAILLFGGIIPLTDVANAQEIVEIEFWHTMEGINGQTVEELVKDFNEGLGAKEGIKVNSVFQQGKQEDKLSTLYQAKDLKSFPNVVQIYSSGIPIIKDFENIQTVQSMYDANQDIIVPQEDLIPSTKRAFSYDNQMISMPFNASSILLYYNVDALKEAGIEEAPKTLAELAEVAKAVKTDDRNGLNVQVTRYQLLNWIGGQGEYNFIGNNEGGRVGGPMSETTMGMDGTLDKFLTEWQKVIDSGALKPVDENMNEEFALGKNAMAIMSSARITKIAELKPAFSWATAPLPKVDATDTGGTAIGGGSIAMFNKEDEAKNRAAWIFTQYMASPDVQSKWGMLSGYLPTNIKTEEIDTFKQYLTDNPNYHVALEQMKASHEFVQEPFDNISTQVSEIIDEYMLDFTEGNLTKEEVVEGMVADLNDALTDYIEANE